MRVLVCSAVLSSFVALAAPANAQIVTRLPDGADHVVALEGGLENAFVARATYQHRLDLGLMKDERFFARATWPFVKPDLIDWALEAGMQATPLAWRDLRLALQLGPVVRNTKNELFDATAFGVGLGLLAGYEGPRWGVSAELGYEQILSTHLDHSAVYKQIAYSGAKDGWYFATGSTTRAGLRGGVRVGAVEIFLRPGLSWTGHFHAGNPPFYATLGAAYAF